MIRTTVEAMAAVSRRNPESPHQQLRRGAWPADRVQRPHRPQHAISPAEETGITRTVDPLGGSYYIEKLTSDLAARAREHMAEIDELAGMTKAINAAFRSCESKKLRPTARLGLTAGTTRSWVSTSM